MDVRQNDSWCEFSIGLTEKLTFRITGWSAFVGLVVFYTAWLLPLTILIAERLK